MKAATWEGGRQAIHEWRQWPWLLLQAFKADGLAHELPKMLNDIRSDLFSSNSASMAASIDDKEIRIRSVIMSHTGLTSDHLRAL